MSEKAEIERRSKGSSEEFSKDDVRHIDNTANTDNVTNLNVKLANPLAGIPHHQLMADAAAFAKEYNLADISDELQKGALVAQDPTLFESLSQLTEEDKALLRREITHKWRQPAKLYYLVILCSMAAAVQGMDEAVINGANLFFAPQFGLDTSPSNPQAGRNQWLLGLVNSAPYLCCGLIGCWVSTPMNRHFGRRGTIFISAFMSFATCIWQGVTNTWWHLFIARFMLGFGVGPKSATVPVYAAECAPAVIRGALVMMWQMWTAFGIMFGYVCDLAFYNVPDKPHITGLNWRLMLGSAGIPALIIMSQVYFCPESPRWLMSKGRYTSLRNSPLQAARDLYYIHVLLKAEEELTTGRNLFFELFTVPRNRRATLAAFTVMFMQQFCGVNAIAYYSSSIFTAANFSNTRNLLLTTFPLMALFLLMAGFAFWIPGQQARTAVVALGIYFYTMAYSPGEGPVPFTYSAEAFPLYVRDIGMSFATAVLWFFNFVVAITFPRLLGAFKPQGAFGWYAGWNIIGFFWVLLAVPETKRSPWKNSTKVLFSVSTRVHALYQIKAMKITMQRYLFRMDVESLPPLYAHEGEVGEKHYIQSGAGPA
ncbi:hypothetical protein B0H21DRAFT_731013 [Amylocystis lapponica]|nr:hypothetical protein B0H21DRAFT_731013 [Amylocystis lapponica]